MDPRHPFAALHALSSHLVPTYEAGGTSVRRGGGMGSEGAGPEEWGRRGGGMVHPATQGTGGAP